MHVNLQSVLLNKFSMAVITVTCILDVFSSNSASLLLFLNAGRRIPGKQAYITFLYPIRLIILCHPMISP